MPDWRAYVRARLSLPDLTAEREARIVRELAAQLEDFEREARARGLSADDAATQADAQIDDWAALCHDLRLANAAHARPRLDRLVTTLDQRVSSRPGAVPMLTSVLTDLRPAVRQLARAPGLAVVAVLTLALGIGASSAIFSVVNGVLLRPLPYPDSQRLVRVLEIVPESGHYSVAPANFLDWRQQNGVFERIAAYSAGTDTFTGTEGPERVAMAAVSWNLFDLLQVNQGLGRGFRAEEDQPRQNDVIVISHGMWQRRFAGDPGVVGRSLVLSGRPVTIVGVMPEGFYFPTRDAEFWRPLALDPATATRGAHYLSVVARLKPQVTATQASAEMKTIAERLAREYPEASRGESADVVVMQDLIVGPIRPMLLTLLAAVGVVVLIACANVANLLLVRASAREREIAIRVAMGAGRRRLLAQMLAESLVLASIGGTLGLFVAYAAIGPLKALSGGSIPRVTDVTLDGRVVAFVFAISMLTGMLFGLAPAWQATRTQLGAVLKEGGRTSVSAGGRRVRSVLLVAEVALSIVLLVGAALLLRSFVKLTAVDPGFRADRVLAFRVALPDASYPEPQHKTAFVDRLLGSLGSSAGVAAAGAVQTLPLRGSYNLSFTVAGRPVRLPGAEPSAEYRVVSPAYFRTLDIPVLRGRVFDARDVRPAPKVALVDAAFARQHFPGEEAIGHGLAIGNGTDGVYQIVGVVGDVRQGALDAAPEPTMYVPFAQDQFNSVWLVVRTTGDPAQMTAVARQAVRSIDPGLPAFSMAPLAAIVSESVAQRRFAVLLLGLFAGVALFLAAVGLYGVVAYSVTQRTQEIGLRLAIGAQPGQVLRMVLGNGMKLALIGTAVGVAGALALSRFVQTMLFDVTPFDPTSYGATAAVLILVSAAACYVPARRAMAVDPLVALRQE